MVVLSLHHVQVLAPRGGEPAARSFYGGLLGLREIHKPATLASDGVWFELDDARQIHVGAFRDGDQPTRNRSHLALAVRSLDAMVARLRSAGIECAAPESGEVPGWRRARARDPFGNGELIEITGPGEQPTP